MTFDLEPVVEKRGSTAAGCLAVLVLVVVLPWLLLLTAGLAVVWFYRW